MTSFKHILTQSANGVKTITLNRPEKRNALCSLLIDELTLALREAESCGRGVVILTGAGSAFCAGLDLEHLETIHAMHAVKRLLAAPSRRQLNEELETPSRPTPSSAPAKTSEKASEPSSSAAAPTGPASSRRGTKVRRTSPRTTPAASSE